ncbi:MAG: ATP-binding protein [Candidatus Omnitrophota bacterium]|nr:ATP-binding protein [Candidatus Omnitrophota bacterium]
MKIKLSWKLTSIFCLIIFLVLAVLYFYINDHLKEYLEQRIKYSLKHDLLLNKNLIENELRSSIGPANASMLANRIGKSLDVRATIISPDGIVTGDSELAGSDLRDVENHMKRPEIQDALKREFGESKRFSTTRKTHMLYMATPLGENGSMGFLRLAMPLSEIELIELKIQKIIAVALVLAIILTLILGAIISIMISKPLSEMSDVAKQMAKGNFSKRIYKQSNDEIGALAEALNYMAEEVENKAGKISYEEAKLDAVISSMFEGVILTDKSGNIIMINPSLRKLFFIDSSAEGKRLIEVVRNNDIQDMVDRIMREKNALITEIATNTPEEKIVRISGVPIIKNGTMEGIILVFHDITELKRLERVRQDFVANVSHELRTPLSNIKGYSETLLGGAIEDKPHAMDFINIIYRESDRLAKLIDDLLDISRIESGKMKMVLLSIDSKIVVTKVLEILKKSAHDKSINITIDIPGNLPKVLADESRLTQAVLNLMDNAIKYTPKEGSIKIHGSQDNGFVKLDVSDTGIGIPEKDLPRIFERFYRVDKARSRELGGTGLGLSIVKHIIQAHGGEVWVKSAPGNGSIFSFTIPTV